MPPKYISDAFDAIQTDISYSWDDTNNYSIDKIIDHSLLERLRKLPQPASSALTIAIAEWIVWRFEKVTDITPCLHWIDAAWLAIIDTEKLNGTMWTDNSEERSWKGPIQGVLNHTMARVQYAIEDYISDDDPGFTSIKMYNLAMYVLPNTSLFEIWYKKTLKRLEGAELIAGTVSRETFNPEYKYSYSKTEELNDAFIQSLDFSKNPYLCKIVK